MSTPNRPRRSKTPSYKASPTNEVTTDPYSYDFDPSSLTMAQLRSLLFKHDIPMPANIRKKGLVDLFEKFIRPQAAELSARRNTELNAQPDDRGIMFLDKDVDDRDDSGVLSSPRSRRSVSFAASVSGGSDDEMDPDTSNFSEQNPFQGHAIQSSPTPLPRRRSKKPVRRTPSIDSSTDEEEEEVKEGRSHDEETDPFVSVRKILWRALSFLAVVSLFWSSYSSREVGFCDTDRPSNSILDTRENKEENGDATLSLPDFLQSGCTTCPPHAHCKDGKLLQCESSDYELSYSLLALFPLFNKILPLSSVSPRCVPDTQKVLYAAELADEMEGKLRYWAGDVVCGRAAPHKATHTGPPLSRAATEPVKAFGLPSQDLYQEFKLNAQESGVLDDHPSTYFDELWTLAYNDLVGSGKVKTTERPDNFGLVTGSSSSMLLIPVRSPLGKGPSCMARLSARKLWKRSQKWLALLVILVSSVLFVINRFTTTKSESARVSKLIEFALETLRKQQYSHALDPVLHPQPFLSTTQLRDHVLSQEHDEMRRKRLWNKVGKVVEGNANVRTRQAKVRGGEFTRVWEWVGVIDGSSLSMESKGKSHFPSQPKHEEQDRKVEFKAKEQNGGQQPLSNGRAAF